MPNAPVHDESKDASISSEDGAKSTKFSGFPSLRAALSACHVHSTMDGNADTPLRARLREHRSQATRGRIPGTPSPVLEPQSGQNSRNSRRMSRPSTNPSMNISIPRVPRAAEAALTALKCLPTPLIVLSNTKTVVLANEAMGRLLGLDYAEHEDSTSDSDLATEESLPSIDMLRGQSLSQLGIDVVQDGTRLWVSWDKFLDGLADEFDPQMQEESKLPSKNHERETMDESTSDRTLIPEDFGTDDVDIDSMQTIKTGRKIESAKTRKRSLVHDAVVSVVISSRYIDSIQAKSTKSKDQASPNGQIAAKMIITIWMLDGQRHYSLTFTTTNGMTLSSSRLRRSYSQTRPLVNARTSSNDTRSNPSSPGSPNLCPTCGAIATPGSVVNYSSGQLPSLSPFPPMGAPSKADLSTSPTVLQKMSRLKDGLINTLDIPVVAMWKDESLSITNRAANQLMFHDPDASLLDPTNIETNDLLSRYRCYDETFECEIGPEDYPIVQLVRTEQPFKSRKIGIVTANGQRGVWECQGQGIYDKETGKFLAGVVALKDVTKYEERIKSQEAENDQQFELICETMPQMLWTTTPTGQHDWFSRRWYDYTGLSVAESIGEGWRLPFHEDDIPVSGRLWKHSLETGAEYSTEYRCRRYDGEWRWMLGQAKPLRDGNTGQIVKWFGSCTDIHELVEARRAAKENRQQLQKVIKHAKVTVWAVDSRSMVTFFEGQHPWRLDESEVRPNEVGRKIYDVFEDIEQETQEKHAGKYRALIETLLSGKETKDLSCEHFLSSTGRWIRTRFIPVYAKELHGGEAHKPRVNGVIGISFDFTDVKNREMVLESRKKENVRLLAAETAAKEASRLKSQFLANMSHEIRTPIAGVIGMSDLLIDTKLNKEQREFADNIQRSAHGLLTVINDILDLSKVESGRLDIEEVQFSLSIVIEDVCKMLSFAADRKNLSFKSDIHVGLEHDLIVMGDPGRIRQILTNLLTNSIKFTSQGYVRLAVKVRAEQAESITIDFIVEDTGIGIEEAVRHRLFKPFTQADSSTARRFGGTGLGLTICKNLVELMHGEISLESELERGTKAEFWIPFNKPSFEGGNLPLVAIDRLSDRLRSEMSVSGCSSDKWIGENAPSQRQDQSDGKPLRHKSPTVAVHDGPSRSSGKLLEKPLDRKSIHVLVVEDNSINQQIALKTIEKLGFSSSAVWNGQEALEYLEKNSAVGALRPDIILMDVQMPILDGYRATHIIRHHNPFLSIEGLSATPIIAMTASAIQGDREKCQKAGMDDYLAKPVRPKSLEAMLLKWAEKHKRVASNGGYHLHNKEEHDRTCTGIPQPGDAWNPSTDSIEVSQPHSSNTAAEPCTEHVNRSQTLAQMRERVNEGQLHIHSAHKNYDAAEHASCRERAEEEATLLRDDKLYAATQTSHSTGSVGSVENSAYHQPSNRNANTDRPLPSQIPSDALTEANINRFARQNQAADYDLLREEQLETADLADNQPVPSPPIIQLNQLPNSSRATPFSENNLLPINTNSRRSTPSVTPKPIQQPIGRIPTPPTTPQILSPEATPSLLAPASSASEASTGISRPKLGGRKLTAVKVIPSDVEITEKAPRSE